MRYSEIMEAKKFELFGDGRTVWVNAADGSSIARFGRMGIDVHTSASEQEKPDGCTEPDWLPSSFSVGSPRTTGVPKWNSRSLDQG